MGWVLTHINLQPIPIPYLEEALRLDAVSTIEEYSIWGGVPRYWELREEYTDLNEALAGTMLSPIGVLYDEPKRLFLDDLTSAVQSESLMSVIATGANRLSEIASRIGRDSTALSAPLDKLIQMNFVRREIPFGENTKNSKKSLYKISDPFMNFYYTFIVPNLSNIGRGRKNLIIELINNHLGEYISGFWEYLCRESISGNKLFGKIWGEASRWWGSIKVNNVVKQLEFDLIAESMDGDSIMIGECKWTTPEIASVIINQLIEKAKLLPFATGKKLVPVLFLKSKPKDYIIDKEIKILYPEDIIKLNR